MKDQLEAAAAEARSGGSGASGGSTAGQGGGAALGSGSAGGAGNNRGGAGGSGSNNSSSSSFDWQSALLAYAQLAAEPSGAQAGAAQGRSGGAAARESGGAAEHATPSPRQDGEGQQWELCGSEHPSPLGRPWAAVWRGPDHAIFGHDAKRYGFEGVWQRTVHTAGQTGRL